MAIGSILAMAVLLCVAPRSASAQATAAGTGGAAGIASPWAPKNAAEEIATNAAITAYWTEKRMRDSKPYPTPASALPMSQLQRAGGANPGGAPGMRTGFNPEDPEATAAGVTLTFDAASDLARGAAAPQAVVIPESASYPSVHTTFQYQGKYLTYPVSTLGKVFFTQTGLNYQCSGSLIGYKYVVTAGHCVHSGNASASGWSTNFMFCPDYDSAQGGVNPSAGCWTTNLLTTATAWYNSTAEAGADIGLAIFGNSGTVFQNYPGNVQGWLGYAWNWGVGQSDIMFGYPAQDRQATANNVFAHFEGGKIFGTAAEEAGYTIAWGSYAPSKFLGTIQTPGTSGGPWVLGWGMKYYNTWGLNAVNGVNSHQRCYDANPPCADRYKEISSPQFIRSGNGNGVCSGTCGVVDTIDWTLVNFP